MREIKFRAWHIALKKMFYDVRTSKTDWVTEDTHYGGGHVTLMQYTGKNDSKGQKIYEGDVIEIDKDRILVIWDSIHASFGLTKNGWAYIHWFGEALDAEKCEVIGNKFQNPELLGEAKP